MEQRISLITLAVADLDRSRAFYEALGWQALDSPPGLEAFDLIGQTLGLYPRDKMVEETTLPPAPLDGQFSGVVLSHNLASRADVAPLLDRARAAGARVLKEAQDTFWGGHHGHFADPDGHVWEIAHNPFSALGPNGEFQWGGVQ